VTIRGGEDAVDQTVPSVCSTGLSSAAPVRAWPAAAGPDVPVVRDRAGGDGGTRAVSDAAH
jgi:hypothetical protein